MLQTRGDNVDTGGVDAAVPQDICQLSQILVDGVKGTGKQLAQIVWKNLGLCHLRNRTELLHSSPDGASVQRTPSGIAEEIS